MKKLISFLIFCSFLQIAFAQGTYTETQRKKDKAKLDSICKKSPNSCIYYSDVIGGNSVFRKFAPRTINRTQKICFNKKFEYISTTDGKRFNGCLYVNTISGYVAQFTANDENSCDGMSNPQPGFEMIISSKIGESYIFRIDNRGKKTFIAQMPMETVRYGGETNFRIKNVNSISSDFREPFTNQNLPTLGYYINGVSASSVKYLFGPYYAEIIPLKDYFGAFGLGYYTDGMGNTFISLAVESIDQFVKVVKITDVNECFDASRFKDESAEAIETSENNIKEREKELGEKEKNIGDCTTAQDLIDHKRKIIEAEEQFNSYVKNGGNLNSKEGLRLATKAQNVTDQVITHRLETEIKICKTENALENAIKEYSAVNNQNTLRAKIECYKKAESSLKTLESQLKRIDSQQGTNYANAAREKNILYLKTMKDINLDCNFKKGQLQSNPMNPGAQELGQKLREMLKKNKRK